MLFPPPSSAPASQRHGFVILFTFVVTVRLFYFIFSSCGNESIFSFLAERDMIQEQTLRSRNDGAFVWRLRFVLTLWSETAEWSADSGLFFFSAFLLVRDSNDTYLPFG